MPIMFTEQEAKKIHTFTLQLCVRPYHDSARARNTRKKHITSQFRIICLYVLFRMNMTSDIPKLF